MSHGLMPNEVAEGTRLTLAPLARGLHRVGITANAVTVIGVLITIAGSVLLIYSSPVSAYGRSAGTVGESAGYQPSLPASPLNGPSISAVTQPP